MTKKSKKVEVKGDKPESKKQKTAISDHADGSLFKASCWDTCLDVVCAGISAVPADPATGRVSIGTYTGRTDDYTRYTRRLPKLKDFKEWNCDEAGIAFPGLAVICGKVSGNLCALEFYRVGDPNERMWLRFVRLLPNSLWRKLVIEQDQDGYRIYYRAEEARPSVVLGVINEWQLAAVVGEGGHVLCYPTTGYRVVQGTLKNVALLSAAEESFLMASLQAVVLDHGDPIWYGPQSIWHPAPIVNAESPAA